MTKLISIENLSYTVPYGETILKNINLEIGEGEFIGILGHNGSGKTTLLDIINGFRGATSGSIEVLKENPHSIERKYKTGVVFLSQDVTLKGRLTIGDFLKFHAAFYPNYSLEDQAKLLEIFQLDVNSKIGFLSTGQQKKVQIVSGFSSRPRLIVIDEITAVLDPEARDIFFRELIRVKESLNCSILLATNIAEDLVNKADKVLFIEKGNAKFYRSTEILNLFNIEKAA